MGAVVVSIVMGVLVIVWVVVSIVVVVIVVGLGRAGGDQAARRDFGRRGGLSESLSLADGGGWRGILDGVDQCRP